MKMKVLVPVLALVLAGCAQGRASSPIASAGAADPTRAAPLRPLVPSRHAIVPLVAHHQHLMSPELLKLFRPPPPTAVELPPQLDTLLRLKLRSMGSSGVTGLYSDDARLVGQLWMRGAAAIESHWAGKTLRPTVVQQIIPRAYEVRDRSGYIAGTVVVTEHGMSKSIYDMLLVLEKDHDGGWRIALESATTVPEPTYSAPITADMLIAEMNDAGIERGLVLSLAYLLARAPEEAPGELARVRAENDWTVDQVAAFPDRLVAFCSVNPLRDHAVEEMDRCRSIQHVAGMKLHFGGSVDLANVAHVEKLRRFFQAANEREMPILVHLAMNSAYGPEHARVFLDDVLPMAPGIPVQIAHAGSGGPYRLGKPDEAMAVFAEAISSGNPSTKNLYLDITGSVLESGQSPETLDALAQRLRQAGLHRILFGSDMRPVAPPAEGWATFRRRMPLTDDELRVIANNVAPYMRAEAVPGRRDSGARAGAGPASHALQKLAAGASNPALRRELELTREVVEARERPL